MLPRFHSLTLIVFVLAVLLAASVRQLQSRDSLKFCPRTYPEIRREELSKEFKAEPVPNELILDKYHSLCDLNQTAYLAITGQVAIVDYHEVAEANRQLEIEIRSYHERFNYPKYTSQEDLAVWVAIASSLEGKLNIEGDRYNLTNPPNSAVTRYCESGEVWPDCQISQVTQFQLRGNEIRERYFNGYGQLQSNWRPFRP